MPSLTVTVDGKLGAGKTTLTEILYNNLQDAGYDVCLEGDAFRNQLVSGSRLKKLPETYLRTQISLVDSVKTVELKGSRVTPAIASAGVLAVVIGFFFPEYVHLILTAMVSSVISILAYRSFISH